MMRPQVSADAGSVPCSGSLAWPEKPIRSPTFQVRVGAGASMTGAGGWLAAAVVKLSRRRSRGRCRPGPWSRPTRPASTPGRRCPPPRPPPTNGLLHRTPRHPPTIDHLPRTRIPLHPHPPPHPRLVIHPHTRLEPRTRPTQVVTHIRRRMRPQPLRKRLTIQRQRPPIPSRLLPITQILLHRPPPIRHRRPRQI